MSMFSWKVLEEHTDSNLSCRMHLTDYAEKVNPPHSIWKPSGWFGMLHGFVPNSLKTTKQPNCRTYRQKYSKSQLWSLLYIDRCRYLQYWRFFNNNSYCQSLLWQTNDLYHTTKIIYWCMLVCHTDWCMLVCHTDWCMLVCHAHWISSAFKQ